MQAVLAIQMMILGDDAYVVPAFLATTAGAAIAVLSIMAR
jgi:hypothetical protein